MTYIDYLNNFNRWLESNYLPVSSQLLYFKLLDVYNRAGWREQVQVDNRRLMIMAGVATEKAAINARNKLIEAGLIRYTKGAKGNPSKYELVKIYCHYNSTINSRSDSTIDSRSNSAIGSTIDSHIRQREDIDNIYPHHVPLTGDGDGQRAISALIDSTELSDTVKKKLREWLLYKGQKAYKLASAEALISRTRKSVDQYGDSAVCDVIDESMANGYKGIIWDKLNRAHGKTETLENDSFDVDDFFQCAVNRGMRDDN